ncbi:uncharacterized protein, partial [Cicer arietinum]|uniref:Pentatricopeptide repeat-containing protein At2g06000-like n=1 Tax=Cicer arietinum TaxID=3827 RepID=A0A1S2Z260_CICAR
MTFPSLFTPLRISKTTLITHYTTLTPNKPNPWFVKIVSTVFLLSPNSFNHTFSHYLANHLTPSLALDVIKRLNNPQLGFKFFQFTKQKLNLSHSFWTYNFLLRFLCQQGQHNSAKLVYDSMRIKEVDRAWGLLKESDFAPNVVSYTILISGYCKLSKMKEASRIFDEMVRSGIKPSAPIFNALIDGFVKAGDMASALGIHKKMILYGCTPDVVTFTSLIDGYCRVGQVDYGLELWREMKARNISESLYTFSILISALCKCNRLQEAHELLRLLKQSDIVPKPFIYNPVIDGYCKSGNVDEANAIVVDMEEKCKPDKLTFTILIIGHCMKGRAPEAIRIFYKMLATGCSPDDITIR